MSEMTNKGRQEFIGQIIGCFEDFLKTAGIGIPDSENYGELRDRLEALIGSREPVDEPSAAGSPVSGPDPESCRRLYELAVEIAADAPPEDECSNAENEFYAECANIANCYPDYEAEREAR